MSTLQQTKTRAAARPTEEVQFTPERGVGWWAVRISLALIIIIWTLPTFGLLVSSLRDKDALATSGWWTSLIPTVGNDQARVGDDDVQQEIDGRFVISGRIFEEGDNRRVQTFGDGFIGGELTDHQAGATVETEDGWTFTIDAEGNYELSSSEAFAFERPPRFFFQAALPPRVTFDNYIEVINSEGIGQAFLNTLTVVIPSTIIPIAIAAFAAYAFSWMEFPGRRQLFYVVVALMVVPLQMALIPILRIYSNESINLVGQYPGIWLAHTGFGLPLAIFLLRNYIGGLPRELIESAQIDGASHFDIFMRLILPLSIPALASFAIFQFLWVWNDMLVALVFLGQRDEVRVLTVQLAALTGSRGDNWEILTAAAFVSIIVPLVVFFALQRYFVRGLLAGSVKGG